MTRMRARNRLARQLGRCGESQNMVCVDGQRAPQISSNPKRADEEFLGVSG